MPEASVEAGAVIFAKDLARMTDFYAQVLMPSIASARVLAAGLGGELNPPDREWQFGSYKVCDGHDTEGNVIQLRERAS